ncbi:MAG: YdcF family protein [Humibacillus sp.]
MIPPVLDALIAIAATLLHIVSTAREPRRWRNGVLLLLVLWSLVDLVIGPVVVDRVLAGLGADPGYGALVVLGLPWLASVVIGTLLLLNGLRLVRPRGRSLGNILSLVLGLGVVAATATGAALVASGSPPVSGAGLVVLLLPGYPALAFTSYLLYCLDYLRRPARSAPCAVVVLGSGLVHGAVPRLLACRLDAAVAVRRREELAGRRPLLVPSGGQGDDEPTSEGAAMTAYLLERGLEEDDVLTEDRATTTEENLVLSRDLLVAQGITGPVRVVTSSYHVGRAALLTRRIGLDADVTGARTAWYFVPSAFLREFVAALTYHPWINAAGMLGWVLGTSALTYAVVVH